MDNNQLIARIDKLLNEVQLARNASPHDDLSGGIPMYELSALGLRLKACIVKVVPADSVYFEAIKDVNGHAGYVVNAYASILEAIRSDIQEGYFDQAASFTSFNNDSAEDDTPFNKQEIEELDRRLTDVEKYLLDQAAKSEQQKDDIRTELAWLKNEIHTNDKKTWKRIFVGTIATKIMDWGLSPEHINVLFHQMVIQGSKLLK